jgi:hypothetical protein
MKYYTLERKFDTANPEKQFKLGTIEDDSEESAWNEVELSMMNSNNQIWLMTEDEFKALILALNKQ